MTSEREATEHRVEHPDGSGPDGKTDPQTVLAFGPFKLFPSRRLLMDRGRPVRLGSRPLDILIALTARPGETVDKREIMQVVWPGTTVVEANLAVNINTLRRALGDGQGGHRYIVTTPGRGYAFVAEIEAGRETEVASIGSRGPHNLPARLARLVGRDEVIAELVERLRSVRLLTLAGPGGIGKTSVAVNVAEDLTSHFKHGVWLIDLGRVADADSVPSAVASTLGLELRPNLSVTALVEALRQRHMLLVLDCCEHVIEAAAELAAAVLGRCEQVAILATSREPLRVSGESVRRISPLPSPPESGSLTAADALAYDAVQLFVERARETLSTFELHDADAVSASDICRRLDGLPLAIEFAAARVEAFGVRQLSQQLSHRLPLAAMRRSADARHRTLNALLDWSFQLLSEEERRLLRTLSVFAGSFTFQAANAVAAAASEGTVDITASLLELTSKSLIVADTGRVEPRFRLLETTRAFAADLLAKDPGADQVRRGHALCCLQLLQSVQGGAMSGADAAPALEAIDDVRAALNWAFSSDEERVLAVNLAAASARLWTANFLVAEAREWMTKGLAALDPDAPPTAQELIMRAALASALIFALGMTEEVYANCAKAAAVARALGQSEVEAEAVMIMWGHQIRRPDHAGALELCRRYLSLTLPRAQPASEAMASYMLGNTLHSLGKVAESHVCLARSLEVDTPEARQMFLARYGFCRRIHARDLQTYSIWQSGYSQQALRLADENLAEARGLGYPLPFMVALAGLGFLHHMAGSSPGEVEPIADDLIENGERLKAWESVGVGRGLKGAALLQLGDAPGAATHLQAALDAIAKAGFGAFHPFLVGAHALALQQLGELERGLAAIDAYQATRKNDRFLFLSNLLQVRAGLLALRGDRALATAEETYRQAIEVARSDGALVWELRAALDFARFLARIERRSEARSLIEQAIDRFPSGADCRDLAEAARLL